MASISRNIFTDDKAAAYGFISLLMMLCFQPRKFFRLIHRFPKKHSVLVAILILGLLSYSAILQAELNVSSYTSDPQEEYLPDDEYETIAPISASDPSQSWMTAMTALGKQAIYWLVLTLVLSEVSLFKGKTPDFGRNLQIAVWSSLPFAMMAALQIMYLMGGGQISAVGFTGFLAEWQSYYELNPYMQSAVYALAARFTFFTLWSFVLLYKGTREGLRGNRLVVTFVLLSWFLLLTLALGFENYQQSDELASFSYEDEIMPDEEMSFDEPESTMNGEDLP